MASDRLYELALEYRKTKLWQRLYDSEMFAVRLENDEIAYCCVMGNNGEIYALAAYVGEKGYDSYLSITDWHKTKDDELILTQDCVQCGFESKEYCSPEELESARAYGKAHGITFRGRNAYPLFRSYKPYRDAWKINEEEEDILCQVLKAAIFVAEDLGNDSPLSRGFTQTYRTGRYIPLIEKTADGYTWGKIQTPAKKEPEYTAPVMSNEILAASIRRLQKTSPLECRLICLTVPTVNKGERPYYPFLLIAAKETDGTVIPMLPSIDYLDNPEAFVATFAQTLKEMKQNPAAVYTLDRDERTRKLLQDLCGKCHIPMKKKADLPRVDDMLENLHRMGENEENEGFSEEEEDMLLQLLEMLDNLSVEEIRKLPGEAIFALKLLPKEGMPEDTKKKLEEALKGL